MSDFRYKDGDLIESIHFTNGESFKTGQSAESISIVMEDGMHCGIPHAMVTRTDGQISKWCVHSLEGIILATGEEIG